MASHLVAWEARHDNGWTTLVMEQSDGTFVAWAGPDESVGVDYAEDTPEHAQAAAMFALKRKSGHAECPLAPLSASFASPRRSITRSGSPPSSGPTRRVRIGCCDWRPLR